VAAAESAEQAELAKLQRYVGEASTRVVELQQLLQASEQRNRLQSELIDALEARHQAQLAAKPDYRLQVRERFFHELAGQLPLSPVYRVERDRLVVQVDPVFIFRSAEIGAEGEARLAALAPALQLATQSLPGNLAWRLHVQGHSDARPLRGNAPFPSNWGLSAARAVAFLHQLRRNGIAERHLYASGLAATRLAATGNSKAAHRKNRRIEVHLELGDSP
jgi:chemotaxis protein MotB